MSSNILMTEITQVQKLIGDYHQIFYYCRLIAILCGGGASILFIVFEIPKVLGELTGMTAKKKIKEFEKKNASVVRYPRKKFCKTIVLQDTKDSNETVLLEDFTSCHEKA